MADLKRKVSRRLIRTTFIQKWIRELLLADGSYLAKKFVFDDEGRTLGDALSESERFPDWITRLLLADQAYQAKRILLGDEYFALLTGMTDFERRWKALKPYLPVTGINVERRKKMALSKLSGPADVENALLDTLCVEDRLYLNGAEMRFLGRRELWVLINEILVDEEYYFVSDTDTPRILDCGSHIGMAVYYFKQLYPKAVITGFEPAPQLYQIAIENVRANKFDSVRILPYALSNENETESFYISHGDSMASSLTQRRHSPADSLQPIDVECRRLSQYLDEPVHFLKLDIEGAEYPVLEEAQEALTNVQHLFCEVHFGKGLENDRLARILEILSANGFDVHVAESYSGRLAAAKRPLAHVHVPISYSIWGKNLGWRG